MREDSGGLAAGLPVDVNRFDGFQASREPCDRPVCLFGFKMPATTERLVFVLREADRAR